MNTTRRFLIFFAALFFAAIAMSGLYIAQAKRSDTENREPLTQIVESAAPVDRERADVLDMSDAEMREVVEVMSLFTLEKELALTEDQLTRVLPTWRQLIEMRSAFWETRRERLDALRRKLDDSSANDAEMLEAAAEFRQRDDDFWAEYRMIENDILAELSPRQKVEYTLIDSEQPRKAARLYRTLRRINRADAQASVVGAPEVPATTTASR